MWVREPEVAAAVNERRENAAYLPGVELPAGLRATPRLDEALGDAETVLFVVPSEYCRGSVPAGGSDGAGGTVSSRRRRASRSTPCSA